MNTGIIYKWTNKLTGEAYIGQTMHETQRIIQHMKATGNNKFHVAIREYGIENFSYEVLERDIEEKNLSNRELYWVKFYDTQNKGYNGKLVNCFPRNRVISEETRKKLSDSRKALKGKIHHSEETKKKIGESNKGKHSNNDWLYTEEINAKRADSCKKFYEEHPGYMSGKKNPFYGKHHSEETRKKLKEIWAKRKAEKLANDKNK